MSKMAIFWATLYFGNLAGAILHPIHPMVAYLAFYYLPPHLNWWGRGVLPDLRYSLLASGVLLLSVLFVRSNMEPLKREWNPAMPWLLAWGANTALVTAWALQTARSWAYTVVCLKLVLLYALIPAAVRTPNQFDIFGAAHVAGAFYWGYKAWDNPKRSAGRLAEVGGPDTQSDNQAAGHLLTVLPFAALYVLTVKRRVPRLLSAVAAAFIVNVFILCNSRGATTGLVVAGLAAIVLAGKGRRKKFLGVAALGAVAVLYMADPEFIERQQTTTNPQDGSALSRCVLWGAGLEMVRDMPFGGGGRTFHILSARYLPQSMLERRQAEEKSPHNTFIQLATDWGVQGFVFYSGFMFGTLWMLHRIRKRTPDNTWYVYRSLAIETALIGTFTAGMFTARLYGESIYWMCALAFALYRIQSTELEADGPVVVEGEASVTSESVELRPAAAARHVHGAVSG
ncbi:MAG: O-antigen ligase family protein [Chloroflexi bacterium]|nr:O-antigen ligase family protein [Chloroflexota bacterium]